MKKPYVVIPAIISPAPTANVPSGTALRAASSDRCARCDMQVLIDGTPATEGGPGGATSEQSEGRFAASGVRLAGDEDLDRRRREDREAAQRGQQDEGSRAHGCGRRRSITSSMPK